MTKYKLVVADVDGTLLPPTGKPAERVSKRIIDAVHRIQEKDVAFSVATARSLDWITALIDALQITSPIILDNGARIYHCGEKQDIFKSFLAQDETKSIFQYLSNLHVTIHFSDTTGRYQYDPKMHTLLESVVKIMVLHQPAAKIENISQELSKKFPSLKIMKSVSGHDPVVESVHITSKESGKDAALKRIIDYLHIDQKEVIGIGDSYNDIEMLHACGLKVAVGNAVLAVKEIADYIAPSYMEDGVADVLEKFILFHDTHGEQKDQLLITVDKEGNSLGTATREESHKGDGKTHLAFMAFVIDKEGNLILTKRSTKKSLWGGYWDASVVSHVLPGETVEEAANRRGKEELGIDVKFRIVGAFYYFAKHGDSAENEYCHVLIGKTAETINPNPVEIDGIRRAGVREMKRETEVHPDAFTPWLKIAIEKFSNMLH